MAKIAQLKAGFVRPAPRPIVKLQPEDVAEFVKGWTEPESFWVENTPEVAQAVLDNMGPNRALKEINCDRMTRNMLTGHFYRTNIGTGFNVLGEAFDGKNRQTAIVRSGETQIMLWVVGLPVEAQAVIDHGAVRSFADQCRIDGYINSILVAAATQGLYNLRLSRPVEGKDQYIRLEKGSLPELKDIREHHKTGLIASVTLHEKIRLGAVHQKDELKKLLPGGLLVAIHYVAKYLLDEEDKADVFMERMIKWPRFGDIKSLDPWYQWGNYLNQRKMRSDRADRVIMMVGTIQAWNLTLEGKKLTKPSWIMSDYAAFKKLDYDLI